jgi:hypothetical protein
MAYVSKRPEFEEREGSRRTLLVASSPRKKGEVFYFIFSQKLFRGWPPHLISDWPAQESSRIASQPDRLESLRNLGSSFLDISVVRFLASAKESHP